MSRFRSVPPTALNGPSSQEAFFTKELLADTSISYLKELTHPENAQVDLVAVHGLNVFGKTNAFGVRTWIAGKPSEEVLWLKDLLPHQLPNARVLLFGYNSNVGKNTSTAGLSGAAENLLARLRVKRQNDPRRPIVFLAHSLGGIVIKHAISMAKNSLEYSELYPSIRAIAFFATPHRGGLFAREGQAAAGILQHLTRNPRSSNLEALRCDSHISPEIHRLFKHCLTDNKIRVCTFYEARPMSILKHLIVDGNSARLDLGEPLEVIYQVPESNHSTICKFEGATEDYEVIMGYIINLVDWALISPLTIPDALFPPGSSSGTPPISRQLSGSSFLDSDLDLPGLPFRWTSPRPPSALREQRDSEAKPQPLYQLPNHTASSKFTGRQPTLDLVQGLLGLEHGRQTRIALYGLGGVGKTQIALKVISWYQDTYPRRSIFWLCGRSAAAFRESLANVAVICGLVKHDDNTAQYLGQLYEFLSDEENGKWLVVIDNADNADTFGITTGLSKQDNVMSLHRSSPIIECIPKCSHGQILITTNSKSMGEKLSLHGHVEEVQPMDQFESTLLFKRQFVEATSLITSPPTYQREIPTDQDIQKLCTYLGHLPLAITQAAAFMREQSQTVTGYIELLEKDDASIMALLEQNFHGYGVEDDFSKAVASTWGVAFDQIESKWPLAADILSLMAFLDAEAIPKTLLQKYESDESKLSVHGLGTLQGYALIYPDTKSKTFRIHRLVQVAMRQRLGSIGSAGKWASTTLKLLTDSFPNMGNHPREVYMALLPHAQQVLRHDFLESPADKLLYVKLASNVSRHQLKDGHLAEAEMYGQKAWERLQSVPNFEKGLDLEVKETWAQALRKVGQFDRAEKITKEAWTGQKKLHGSTSLQASQLATLLASVYQDQGYYDKAAKVARETIQSLEKKRKDKKPTSNDVNLNILDAKSRLAIILEKLGDHNEAEKVILEANHGYSAISGLDPEDPQILKGIWRHAYILHSKEMYDESNALATETWEAQKRVVGENDADCIMSELLIANNFEARGNFERALSIKKDIYSRAIMLVGFEHRYAILAGESLASGFVASAAHASRKQAEEAYREAEDLYQSALVWSRTNIRADHPDVLSFKTGIATILRLRGQLREAEDMQRAGLRLKTGLSVEHRLTLAAEENLARILWEGRMMVGGKEDGRKVKEAKKLALQVLKIKERKTGWRSRETARIAGLVVEMPVDGKQRLELRRKLDEHKTVREEYGGSRIKDGGSSEYGGNTTKDGGSSWDDSGKYDGDCKEG